GGDVAFGATVGAGAALGTLQVEAAQNLSFTGLVRVSRLVLTVANGVGSAAAPVQTTATQLRADGGAGGVFVHTTGPLTLEAASAPGPGATTAPTPLPATGPAVSAADVTLTAPEGTSPGPGDNLTVLGGASVRSTGGAVTLQAGDAVSVLAGAAVEAAGLATL